MEKVFLLQKKLKKFFPKVDGFKLTRNNKDRKRIVLDFLLSDILNCEMYFTTRLEVMQATKSTLVSFTFFKFRHIRLSKI